MCIAITGKGKHALLIHGRAQEVCLKSNIIKSIIKRKGL